MTGIAFVFYGGLYVQAVIISLSAGVLLNPFFVESEYLDTLVNGILIDLLHIVVLRLGEIDRVQLGHLCDDVDVVISASAEVDSAAVIGLKQLVIVGRAELLVELRGEVHGAVVTKNYGTLVPEIRPMGIDV